MNEYFLRKFSITNNLDGIIDFHNLYVFIPPKDSELLHTNQSNRRNRSFKRYRVCVRLFVPNTIPIIFRGGAVNKTNYHKAPFIYKQEII